MRASAVTILLLACLGCDQQSATPSPALPVKMVIVTMFERGADEGDAVGGRCGHGAGSRGGPRAGRVPWPAEGSELAEA